jgi:uncharacterized protein YbcI
MIRQSYEENLKVSMESVNGHEVVDRFTTVFWKHKANKETYIFVQQILDLT